MRSAMDMGKIRVFMVQEKGVSKQGIANAWNEDVVVRWS